MKRRLQTCLLLPALLVLAALLSGCTVFDSSVEQLFTLPRMAPEYTGLSQQLDSLVAQGYEYAPPSGGRNIQSVQMVDLEDDGRQEALVFLRRTADERPLKILVFRLDTTDSYRLYCTVESSGAAVDSVYYQDLNGDGRRELIVGWRISADVQTLAAYSIEPEPVALMSCGYSRFSIQDLNSDGVPSLLVLRTDGELGPVAEFYGWQDEQMSVSYRCRLSSSMTALNRGSIVTGMVDKDTPAVFITGVDATSMAVTDILVYRQEAGLVNVAMDKSSGVSAAVYPFRQLSPQDIDGDGLIELPCPLGDGSAEQTDGLVSWMSWRSDGRFEQSVKTYHSLSAGWYFTIPQSWWDWDVDAVTTGIQNESQMTLRINGDAVLSIYTITGENRESRSRMDHRLVLRRQAATVYAGEVCELAPYYGMDEDLLRRSFSLILGSWNNS